MLNTQEVEVFLDAIVGPFGHLLEGKSVLDPLDGSGYGRCDLLDAALDGRLEKGDVSLPSGCPLEGLSGHAFFGARHEHVEGCEGGDACAAEGDDLRAARCRNADGHDDDFVLFRRRGRV